METVRVSRNSTTVITSNGEVQTNEQATVVVNDLDLLVMVQLLLDTPSSLWLGRLCEDHRYSCESIGGHKPNLIQDGGRILFLGLSTGSSEVRLQHKVGVNTVRPGEPCEKFGMDVWITCTTLDLVFFFPLSTQVSLPEEEETNRDGDRASSLQWTHLCVSSVYHSNGEGMLRIFPYKLKWKWTHGAVKRLDLKMTQDKGMVFG